jgi:dienelactone hydrolase
VNELINQGSRYDLVLWVCGAMRAHLKRSWHDTVARAAIAGTSLVFLAACSVYDAGLMQSSGLDASVDIGNRPTGGHGGRQGADSGGGAGGSSGDGGAAGDGGNGGDSGSAGDGGNGGIGGSSGTGGGRGGAAGKGGAGGALPPMDATTEAPVGDGASGRDAGGGGAPPGVDATNPPSDVGHVADRKVDVGTNEGGVGCGATTLLPVPDDPSVRGPWPVGVRTVKIGRLTTEILYPAALGSEQGKTEAFYDIRAWLPDRERSKVPDAHSPAVKPIGGNLFRDLPIDGGHGPYPVVLFLHGTASFRMASLSTMTQWASRGFVVVSADYPGMFLADMLAGTLDCLLPTTGPQDVPGDVATQMQALASLTGDLAVRAGHIDMNRVGLTGHSRGGCITATLSAKQNVRIVIPMAGSAAVDPSPTLQKLMYIGGMVDTVIGYDGPSIGNVVCELFSFSTTEAYQQSPGPPAVTKRLVGLTGGGHLVMTDLCQRNAVGRNAIEEAKADGVCGIDSAVIIGLPALFDCGTIDMATGIKAVDYASTAALEEALMCKDRSAQFASLKANVPIVGDFQEAK